MKEKRYFAGANTTQGFVSYYSKIFGSCDSIYVIKGGPGTGKSRLIKEVAEAVGGDVEYFYCSFDPSSLDGIIINNKIAVIDGTAPHIYDPSIPGAKENIVDLGAFWNENDLREHRSEIKTLMEAKKHCFDMAYSYLNAVGALDNVRRKIQNKYLKKDEIVAKAAKIISDIKPQKRGESGVRIISAFGRNGRVRFDTFNEISSHNIRIENKHGEGYACLEEIKKEAERLGIPAVVSYHPLYKGRIDALMLGGEICAMVDQNEESDILDVREIDAQISVLTGKAEKWLKEASKTHFEIESIYVSAMDFDKKEEFSRSFINKLTNNK